MTNPYITIFFWNNDQIATAEDGPTPDYETRLALVKLLLETAMYDEAFTVLNGLIEENDQVPDTLYLFGWANYIAAEEVDEKAPNADEERREQLENAREALNACVKVRRIGTRQRKQCTMQEKGKTRFLTFIFIFYLF